MASAAAVDPMNQEQLRHLLDQVATGDLAPDQALERLRNLPFENLGFAHVDHHRALARTVLVPGAEQPTPAGLVAVVSAGTSDLPVAREAVVTARAMGAHVEEVCDVGVAGLHRLLAYRELLQRARAIVVVAGMEGALASVRRRIGGYSGRGRANERRLRREFPRPCRPLGHAQLLCGRRGCRQHRQRLWCRVRSRPDQPPP